MEPVERLERLELSLFKHVELSAVIERLEPLERLEPPREKVRPRPVARGM